MTRFNFLRIFLLLQAFIYLQPARADTSIHITPTDEAGYEKVLTGCQDSESFTKIYVVKHAIETISTTDKLLSDLKISVIEHPHHGDLTPDIDHSTGKESTEVWRYTVPVRSDASYFTGQDRAIFLIESNQKKYKVVVNLNIETSIEDRIKPACVNMVFDFSPISMAAVGDIMLGGKPTHFLHKNGYDYPFQKIKTYFSNKDIVMGNLEGPLTERGRGEPGKAFVFRSPPDKVSQALKKAGFNFVALANNHTFDYGIHGLYDTVEALNRAGIAHAGVGNNAKEARKPAVMNIRGTRVAILSYCSIVPENFYATDVEPGIAFGDEASIKSDVIAAKKHADIVIVAFHWGREGTTVLEDYQRKLAHVAIDSGAAAIIGSHPHVLQGVERYKDGVILYSLGNFTFGSYSKTSQVSAIAMLEFEFGRVSSLRVQPINVNNFVVNLQPTPLKGKEADKVVTLLQNASQGLGGHIFNENGVAVLKLESNNPVEHAFFSHN